MRHLGHLDRHGHARLVAAEHVMARSAEVGLGLVLLLIAAVMILSVALIPVGVIVGFAGLTALLWGIEGDRRP